LAKTEKIEKPKPTIDERIAQLESELRQIEQEYWKRIGKIEALKEIHAINEEL
tara:strand:- start:690 stop:848 length:159 start_codon:yes stop_codon:yes gene_type:complete